MTRLIAARVEDLLAASTAGVHEPPLLAAISCVYGVGVAPGEAPEGDGLHPVYRVGLPVDAPDSLDADDTHEFAAADLLATLQTRARTRAWAMRLEFEVVQSATAVAHTDLYLDAAPTVVEQLRVLHQHHEPGGGRRLVVATTLVHTPEAVVRLAGTYRLVQREGTGQDAGTCTWALGLTEFEFESGPEA